MPSPPFHPPVSSLRAQSELPRGGKRQGPLRSGCRHGLGLFSLTLARSVPAVSFSCSPRPLQPPAPVLPPPQPMRASTCIVSLPLPCSLEGCQAPAFYQLSWSGLAFLSHMVPSLDLAVILRSTFRLYRLCCHAAPLAAPPTPRSQMVGAAQAAGDAEEGRAGGCPGKRCQPQRLLFFFLSSAGGDFSKLGLSFYLKHPWGDL